MSDDCFFLPSSPGTIYSLGLDYEQSQHKQEIRDAREAEMSAEELEYRAEQRRLKRIKQGLESPNDKEEEFSPSFRSVWSPQAEVSEKGSPSPARTPRASAVNSVEKTNRCIHL
jgi:hypothetical protein